MTGRVDATVRHWLQARSRSRLAGCRGVVADDVVSRAGGGEGVIMLSDRCAFWFILAVGFGVCEVRERLRGGNQ